MQRAGEMESSTSPRYSGVQYKFVEQEEEVNFEGLVVGIVSYKPVYLFINRFAELTERQGILS